MDIDKELEWIMETNPPFLTPDSKAGITCPDLHPPSNFYDKHIDSSLLLQRIIILPLVDHLASAPGRVLQSLRDNGELLPSVPGEFCHPMYEDAIRTDPLVDANSLGKLYRETMAWCMSIVSSTIILHPYTPGWFQAIDWTYTYAKTAFLRCAHTGDFSLRISPDHLIAEQLKNSLEDVTKATLEGLEKRGRIAFWDFLAISPQAEEVLAEMDCVESEYAHDLCQARGYTADPSPESLRQNIDAQQTGWGESVATFTAVLGSSPSNSRPMESATVGTLTKDAKAPARISQSKKRGRIDPTSSFPSDPKWATITVPNSPSKSPPQKAEISRLFIQRAWSNSVQHDTTYAVFNCGNFERIGFRHRASGTFFLSELINIPECKDPHYGKIQLGLYLSILQDALDRLKQTNADTSIHKASKGKRRRSMQLGPPKKRQRTRAAVVREKAEAEVKRQTTEIARKRPLVLLVFRYGIYNSPAPASFLRIGHSRKNAYTAEEYIKVTVAPEIATGATGTVHGAHVEVMDGTTVRKLDAVVKLAFGSKQCDRMRHESSIYEHLAREGVTEGIPAIYGIFQDAESDVLALVMSHVGLSLVRRYPGFVGRQPGATLSDDVKSAYLKILTLIHEAGVHHNDIRAENLAITDDNEVTIIDFDKAEFGRSKSAQKREIGYLEEALLGTYPSWYDIPSEVSTPERPIDHDERGQQYEDKEDQADGSGGPDEINGPDEAGETDAAGGPDGADGAEIDGAEEAESDEADEDDFPVLAILEYL